MENEKKGDNGNRYFTETVRYVLFLLPLLALIWNAALITGDVRRHEREISELKSQYETSVDRLAAQVADLNLNVRELQTEVRLLREGR